MEVAMLELSIVDRRGIPPQSHEGNRKAMDSVMDVEGKIVMQMCKSRFQEMVEVNIENSPRNERILAERKLILSMR